MFYSFLEHFLLKKKIVMKKIMYVFVSIFALGCSTSKSNANQNTEIIDPWAPPKNGVKQNLFTLDLNEQWEAREFLDENKLAHGYYVRNNKDTIAFRFYKEKINLTVIEQNLKTRNKEKIVLNNGNYGLIFKDKNVWYGYFVHSDNLYNKIEIKKIDDVLLVMKTLKSYTILDLRQDKSTMAYKLKTINHKLDKTIQKTDLLLIEINKMRTEIEKLRNLLQLNTTE
jgi:hypothetical protein